MAEPSIRIPKLRGIANYARWRIDARALFIREDSWYVVCGDQPEPQASPDKPSTEHQAELEKWRRRNDTGWSTMMLILGDGPRARVGTSTIVADIWKKLEELYSADDLSTRNNAFYQLSHLDASKYKNLYEYTSELRKHATKLENMGKPMHSWQLVTCYLQGLPQDLSPYTFNLIQAAKAQKRELDIDEMTSTLSRIKRAS